MADLTFGQKAVGLTFNPSGDPTVQDLKEKAAAFIDACQSFREEVGLHGLSDNELESSMMMAVAIREAQAAQMWAVKAVTWEM